METTPSTLELRTADRGPAASFTAGGALLSTAEPALRTFWYPVARADAIGTEPVPRTLLGEPLVLWRSQLGSPVHAALDRCPHRGAALTKGHVERGRLICPYHGWGYGEDGSCLEIPHLPPEAPIPGRACLAMSGCQEQWGWIWVNFDDPQRPLPASPLMPEADSSWRIIHEPESTWHCPAFQLIDNNLDVTHIPFVHKGSFGGSPNTDGPPVEVEVKPDGVHTRMIVPVESRPGEVGATVRRVEQHLILPLLLISRITYPDGVVQIMVKACSPVGDTDTRQLQVVLRNDAEVSRPGSDIIDFDVQVWKEDHELLGSIWPQFHLDLRREVHLRSDRASVEYRRQLAHLLRPG